MKEEGRQGKAWGFSGYKRDIRLKNAIRIVPLITPNLAKLISLKGRRALVTGAASGIGEATAYRLAEAGASLELVDIDMDGLRLVGDKISKTGVEVNLYKADLSRKDEIDALWDSLRGREPDILINNAGVYFFKDFLELDEGSLDKAISVNLYSAIWMCHHMIKRRLNKGGVIVNVSSIEAILPFATELAHYSISKIGAIALTRTLAREYGRKGFRINAVVPGGIETPGVKKLMMRTVLRFDLERVRLGAMFKSRLPLGRFGKPDEVARVILFLASDLSSYVNGAILPVDGGFLSA